MKAQDGQVMRSIGYMRRHCTAVMSSEHDDGAEQCQRAIGSPVSPPS